MLSKSIIVVVQYLAQSPLSMKPWSAFPEYLLLNGPVQRTLKEITNCETYLDNKPHLEYTKFKKNIFLTEIPCHQTFNLWKVCWKVDAADTFYCSSSNGSSDKLGEEIGKRIIIRRGRFAITKYFNELSKEIVPKQYLTLLNKLSKLRQL